MTQTKTYLYGAIVLAILGIMVAMSYSATRVGASVNETAEYTATSTAANTIYGGSPSGGLIRTGGGTFGSWIITGANTGIVNFYDATTTNVNLRTGQTATSSILIASFPASAAAGTYTFDVRFNRGLYVDIVSGSIATSTITYR